MFDLDDDDDDHYYHDNDEFALFSACLVPSFYKHTIGDIGDAVYTVHAQYMQIDV